MACTITDKEKEVLANAGFGSNKFGDHILVSGGRTKWLSTSGAGLWYAYSDGQGDRGYVAKSRSVSALLAHCQLTDWQPVCTDHKAAPLVGG